MIPQKNSRQDFIKTFEKSILVTGAFLAILGIIGIFAPHVIAFTLEIFLGLLMITGGVFFAYFSYQYHTRSFIGWLKPVILVMVGTLFLIKPGAGIAAFTLLVIFYLLIDAYASFGLAYNHHPDPGWGWLLLNGLLSLTLAVLLMVGWPGTSPIFLGLYISISLLFDGISLFMLGIKLKKAEEDIEMEG